MLNKSTRSNYAQQNKSKSPRTHKQKRLNSKQSSIHFARPIKLAHQLLFEFCVFLVHSFGFSFVFDAIEFGYYSLTSPSKISASLAFGYQLIEWVIKATTLFLSLSFFPQPSFNSYFAALQSKLCETISNFDQRPVD